MLSDDLRFSIGLLEFFGVEPVDHGLELVVVLGKLCFRLFFFCLSILQFILSFLQFLGDGLYLCGMIICSLKVFRALLLALCDPCLGLDEVFLRELVEVSAPHYVLRSVEHLVDLLFREALHGGVVVCNVESHDKL